MSKRRGTVKHKIEPSTPDEVCFQCAQFYDGNCRAMSIPHTEEERLARSFGTGMECDSPRTREINRRKFGFLYNTDYTDGPDIIAEIMKKYGGE